MLSTTSRVHFQMVLLSYNISGAAECNTNTGKTSCLWNICILEDYLALFSFSLPGSSLPVVNIRIWQFVLFAITGSIAFNHSNKGECWQINLNSYGLHLIVLDKCLMLSCLFNDGIIREQTWHSKSNPFYWVTNCRQSTSSVN